MDSAGQSDVNNTAEIVYHPLYLRSLKARLRDLEAELAVQKLAAIKSMEYAILVLTAMRSDANAGETDLALESLRRSRERVGMLIAPHVTGP